MNEIIKIKMELKTNEEEDNLTIAFEQSIKSDIIEILTKEEYDKLVDKLCEINKIISEAITRREVSKDLAEDIIENNKDKIKEDFIERIKNCNTLEELFELAKSINI